jgi:hypothetical protein
MEFKAGMISAPRPANAPALNQSRRRDGEADSKSKKRKKKQQLPPRRTVLAAVQLDENEIEQRLRQIGIYVD